jgi:ribosomal protein L7/L12
MPGEYSQASLEAHFESINKRLRMIEEQLVRISETGGFAYTPSWSEVPEEVIALAQQGKQLEAMKRYRELTGANVEQARDVVVGL